MIIVNDISYQAIRQIARDQHWRLNTPQKLKQALLLLPHHLSLHPLFRLLSHRHLRHQPQIAQAVLQHRSHHIVHSLAAQWHPSSWRYAWLHPCAQPHTSHHQKVPDKISRKAVYFLALASWVVCGLSIIPTLVVFVLSRFLLGVLNGLHMSLASAYIK